MGNRKIKNLEIFFWWCGAFLRIRMSSRLIHSFTIWISRVTEKGFLLNDNSMKGNRGSFFVLPLILIAMYIVYLQKYPDITLEHKSVADRALDLGLCIAFIWRIIDNRIFPIDCFSYFNRHFLSNWFTVH